MKTNTILNNFSWIQPIKFTAVWFVLSFFLSNCYFNPVVNSFLDPKDAEKSSPVSFLALAAGGGSSPSFATALILGQLKDASNNGIAGASLEISGTNNSTKEVYIVSSFVKTDSLGNFTLFLRSGVNSFKVTDSNGNPLGGFTLSVADDNQSASFQPDASATFTVTLISVTPSAPSGGGGGTTNGETETEPSIPVTPLYLISSNPLNGSNSHHPSAAITLTFSEDVFPTNIYNGDIVFSPSASFSASVSKTEITITTSLANKQAYTMTLNSGLKGASGNSLSPSPTVIEFITINP